MSRKDKDAKNNHNNNGPKQKEVIKLNDPKAVLELLGRQERVIQECEKAMAQNKMDLAIMQEYLMGLGGNLKDFIALKEKRLGEAKEQMEEMILAQTQNTLDQHKGENKSGIIGLDGKPLFMDTTPPKDMAPAPGESVTLENSGAVPPAPVVDKDTPPLADSILPMCFKSKNLNPCKIVDCYHLKECNPNQSVPGKVNDCPPPSDPEALAESNAIREAALKDATPKKKKA